MKRAYFLLLLSFLVLATHTSVAQESLSSPHSAQQAQRPPDGGTREMLISILIPTMPSAPFSATVNTTWVKQLPDGSSITLKNHRAIARDAAGRVFQERRMLVPEDSKAEPGLRQIEINDPVAHQRYVCIASEGTCQLEALVARNFARPARAGAAPKQAGSSTLEDLGTQSISGLETAGTRETTVIPSGAFGNNSPLLSKSEYWYSSLLGLNLISKRQDPRFGEQNFEVTDISLGEPDAKLFQPPSGYKVRDLRFQKTAEPSSSDSASSN